MTEFEKKRLNNAENNILELEKRIIELEEQVSTCLRFIRDYAEKLAKKADPDFKVRDKFQA